jgi:hypothetical protein
VGTKLHYKLGSWYRICDRSGFAVRAEHTQKQWNNIIVRNRSFEERQPQDFVRGRRDDQTAPQPRPRQTNVFLGVQTQLAVSTVSSAPFSDGVSNGFQITGARNLAVQSAIGFNVGDEISIQLDNGTTFFTTAQAINFSTNVITPSQPLPYPASAGNIVTDMTSFANV